MGRYRRLNIINKNKVRVNVGGFFLLITKGECNMLNKVLIKEGSQKRVYVTKGSNLKLVDWDFIDSKENE